MKTRDLTDAIDGAGYQPRSYSGRGMFGRKCVGVVTEQGMSPFKIAADIALHLVSSSGSHSSAEEKLHELTELNVKQDSMGLDTIIYFPDVQWEDSQTEDEEV